MDQHLRIASRRKLVAFGGELGVEALVVVDLPIEDHDHTAVLVGDGLMAAREIDDAEPAHTEPDTAFDEAAPIIGASVHDRVAHPADLHLPDWSPAKLPYDPAHIRLASFPRRPSCIPARME